MRSCKSVLESLKQARGPIPVNQWIGAVEIAERALETEGAGFKDPPVVGAVSRHRDREAQFERHVEARNTTAEVHTAEIVQGIFALAQDAKHSFKSTLRCRKLKGRARLETESA